MYILQRQVYVTQKKLLHVKYLLHIVFPGLWYKYSTFRDDVQVIDVDKDGDDDNNPSTAPAAAKKDRIALVSEDDSFFAPATKDTSIDVDSGDDDSDDDDFTDGNGGIDLEKMFSNKPGGVEFTYERDATGRVVSVFARPVAARDVRNKKRSNGDEDDEWRITTLCIR